MESVALRANAGSENDDDVKNSLSLCRHGRAGAHDLISGAFEKDWFKLGEVKSSSFLLYFLS